MWMYFILILFICRPCFAFSLEEMSLEEKVGQLLMVHFHGEEANEEAKMLIQDCYIGGIIYYDWANGLSSPEQVAKLSLGLQELALENPHPIPLFISVDQEGGIVARLKKGFTLFPGNKALGMTRNPKLSEDSAIAIGKELRLAGINFNLSPVVDINSNPYNPVIGIRSFGKSAEEVSIFAKKAIDGYHKAHIITCLKHFPGHGDVGIDSHLDLPIIHKSKEELQALELIPFKELSLDADTIMTAHILVPSIDPNNCATLSKPLLDILRKEIGFTGVIISDSLIMQGLLKNCSSIEEAAIQAFQAGCDILILGGKGLHGSQKQFELTPQAIKKIYKSLVEAVKNGRILESRLNAALERILQLKNKYKLQGELQPINVKEHEMLSKKIAALALRVTKNKKLPPHLLKQGRIALFAPGILRNTIDKISLCGLNCRSYFFKTLEPTEQEIEEMEALESEADILLVCSYSSWKHPKLLAWMQSLCEKEKPFILFALKDPLDAALCPMADLIIETFSPTAPSLEAAFDYLAKLYRNEFKIGSIGGIESCQKSIGLKGSSIQEIQSPFTAIDF